MSFKVTLKQYLPEEKAEETRFLEIDKNKINIGTGAGNELQIEGLGISINHASIEKEGEDYYLTDLGSGEDTYLNNERISGKAKLENDYIIKIGSFTFKFLKPETQEEPANINVFKEYKEESKEDEVEIPEISLTFFSRFRLVKSKVNKTNLSLVLIILFFLIIYFGTKNELIFSTGTLSEAHIEFNKDCTKCHIKAWNSIPDIPRDVVLREMHPCLECHEPEVHNELEMFTANCTQCHNEHKGKPVLANIEDKFCTQCHSTLQIKGNRPSKNFHRNISDFENTHPEFAVNLISGKELNFYTRVRLNDENNLIDNTPIKLNHKKHLVKELRGHDDIETLECESCHNVDESGEYITEINYEKNCSGCHILKIISDFGVLDVPHDQPNVIRAYLKDTVKRNLIEKTGGNLIPNKSIVDKGVKSTEKFIYKSRWCSECHTLEYTPGYLPELLEPNIPARWYPHGKFNHEFHVKNLELSCTSCHDAKDSELTQDVLLPSIDNCKSCHSSSGKANTNCVTCHGYHQGVIFTGIEEEDIKSKRVTTNKKER